MTTYSYDPTQITAGGIDQMRFELGDTVVDMDGMASPLCDEEYLAILEKYSGSWRRAKLKCLEAIVMKLSYEVNTSVGGLSYSLNERAKRWQEMLDRAKKEMRVTSCAPVAGNLESLSPAGGTPYFFNDMQTNKRKF